MGAKKASGVPAYRQVLRATDFMSTTPDITLVSGGWVRLNSGYTIPAQQHINYGFGRGQEPDNQGFLYVSIIDDTAGDATQEDGTVRFVQAKAQYRRADVVFEMETEQLDGSQVARTSMIALPEQIRDWVPGEDDILFIEMRARAVDIVQPDFCVVNCPITVYAIS